MKNTYFLSLILILSSMVSTYAQKGNANMERIKAMKVAMITEKLELTESQAKTFWPTYYKFEGERRQINRAVREKMRSGSSQDLSEAEEIAMQDEVFELKSEEAELAKKYRPQFLKSISAKQYSDLVLAEKQFNQMLLRELNERRREKRDK